MFDKVILNADGPFFRNICYYHSSARGSVGRFGAATREGKILMLLHEMAHLIRDGRMAG
jgi:hypothetical protein